MFNEPLGFIGVGNIGNPMALNLIRAGHEIHVFDLDEARMANLIELGANPMESVSDIAKNCPTIITSLPGPKEINEVITGTNGILENAVPGTIHVDLSTNLPSEAVRLAKMYEAEGIILLDAPVSGGVPRAIDGTLAVMVGGPQTAFEKCYPIFEAIGDHIFHMGESGNGALVKLINNLVSISARQTVVEALALANGAGLDPERALEVMQTGSANRQILAGAEKIFEEDYGNPTFALRLARKDLGLALQVGIEVETPTPMASSAYENLTRALKAGYGDSSSDSAFSIYKKD